MKKNILSLLSLLVLFLLISLQGCTEKEKEDGLLIINNKTIEGSSGNYIPFQFAVNGNTIQTISVQFTETEAPRKEFPLPDGYYYISIHYYAEESKEVRKRIWVLSENTSEVDIVKKEDGTLSLEIIRAPENN